MKKFNVQATNASDINMNRPNSARRLLERLNSPLLNIASQISPSPVSHSPGESTNLRRAKNEFEQISGGRLVLAEQHYHGDDVSHRIFHIECGHYSWVSLRCLRVIGAQRACIYCSDPTSMNKIGGLAEVQRFVRHKSLNKAYLLHRNHVGEIDDIYDFYCVRCRLTYQAPFTFFLRYAPETNGCPCCAEREGQR